MGLVRGLLDDLTAGSDEAATAAVSAKQVGGKGGGTSALARWESDNTEAIAKAFEKFDRDKSGTIDVSEMQDVIRAIAHDGEHAWVHDKELLVQVGVHLVLLDNSPSFSLFPCVATPDTAHTFETHSHHVT